MLFSKEVIFMRFAYGGVVALLLMSCSLEIQPIGFPAFFKDIAAKVKDRFKKNDKDLFTLKHAFRMPSAQEIKIWLRASFNPENAAYVGSMLALTVAVPYGSSIVWKSIEQKILHPLADVVDSASHPLYG